MIRVLLMIAAAGFVLAVASLSAAFAIGGPEAMARGGWAIAGKDWGHDDWDWDSADHDWGPDRGPQTTRTLAWPGDDSLETHLPADIRYTQAPGAGSITITGPQRIVERVVIDDGHVRLRGRRHHWGLRKLEIVVSAPNVTRFDLHGANELTIENYRQDRLTLDLSGAAEVQARGDVRLVDVDISGAGKADLGELQAREAEVEISGAGSARIAPTERARLDISGMGEIDLLTDPRDIDTDISGAGTIRRSARATTDTSPASPSPAPKAAR